MQEEKLNPGQVKVTATGFLSLFSIVGIMFYGLSYFSGFWETDFGWNQATVTFENFLGKIIIVPLFGFLVVWFINRTIPILVGNFGNNTKSYARDLYNFNCLGSNMVAKNI